MFIGTYRMPRNLYEYILEAVEQTDVDEFNREFGHSLSREEFAWAAPTLSVLDDVLENMYGQKVAFRAKGFKARWSGVGEKEIITIEVTVSYNPLLYLSLN
ncbi:hypothetical protein EKD04_014360 [Chloroflexales bacterium ZM16-3]|nr:hypothetical protein [Chloroflexales bacterium ZM16-3]